MAFWKKRSGTFEPRSFGSKNCKYGAYYLGKMETDGESGLDCTLKTVNNMYKNYKQSKGRNAQRMMVEVSREGVIMRNENTESNGNKTLLPVVDISFGTAVPGHDKVFAVVVRSEPTPGSCSWYCHGFLCDQASVARDLTLLLVKAFQRASAAGEIDQPTSVDDATKQSKPTTLHILHERGRLEHKNLHRSKSAPAVSTIRVTLNVEYRKVPVQDKPKPKSSKTKAKKSKEIVDGNRAFAEALAKRDFEKDKLGLLDKPVKKQGGGKATSSSSSATATTSSTRAPLRRAKSDSEALIAGKAKLADDKENLDIDLSSESDKDNISDNDSSNHNDSSELDDSEQEIVVAINPLMSILKNPSSPLQAGSTTTVAFRGEVSSPRSDSDDEGSPDKDGSKRAKRKSVRFSEDFAVIT